MLNSVFLRPLTIIVTALALAVSGPALAQSWTVGTDPAGAEAVSVPRDQLARMQARLLELERLVAELTGQVEEARHAVRTNGALARSLSSDHGLRLAQIEDKLGLDPPVSSAPLVAPEQGGLFGPGIATPEANPRPGTAVALVPPAGATRPGEGLSGTGLGVLRVDATGAPLAGMELSAARADAGIATTDIAPPSVPVTPTVDPAQVQAAGSGGAVATAALEAPGQEEFVAVMLPEGTPKQRYDYAFDTLRQQNFTAAQSLFEQFLEVHPDDELAANARYWLGETHYVRQDFEQAAIVFMQTYQAHPKSNKAPDALFKLGQAMANLGQNDQACVALGRLVNDYPTAADYVLQRARSMRQKLACAG